MSSSLSGSTPVLGALAAAPLARDAVYRAIWRWHFYAGLLCLPFLILLSVTGSLYLFKTEINAALLAHRFVVTPRETPPLGPDRLIFNASQAVPDGVALSYVEPDGPAASALVTMSESGRKVLVYLDPYTGDVLDRLPAESEPMTVVRRLHSLAYFGALANGVIEVVAGFAVILVVTGIYMWWPRGRAGGVTHLRDTPRKRVWWRDLHAVTGSVAGIGLLFLAVTGLPWSGWWGQQVRSLSNEAGLGQPRALWAERPVSAVPMSEVLTNAGWAMEDAPLPASSPSPAPSLGTDQAVAILRGLGLPRGYELALPQGEAGVFAASAYPSDVTRQRMVSLDQYTGAPLVDVHFADLGGVARAIQYGIGIHKGEHFGRTNQLAMLAFCLATILLSVTAAIMWWKRRPAGSLGAPPWPRDRRVVVGVSLIVLGLGALFPLTGLVILGMVLADLAGQLLRARRAA